MLLTLDDIRKIEKEWFDGVWGDRDDFDLMLVKAQLKKVGEWGEEECGEHVNYYCSLQRRQCYKCWQSLRKEMI